MEQLLWQVKTEKGTYVVSYEDFYDVYKEVDPEECFCIHHHRYDGVHIINYINNLKEVKVTPYFTEKFKNLLEYKGQKGLLTNNEKLLFDEVQNAKEIKSKITDELNEQYNRYIESITLAYNINDAFREDLAVSIVLTQKIHEFCTKGIDYNYDIINYAYNIFELKVEDNDSFYEYIIKMYNEFIYNNETFNIFDWEDIRSFLKQLY